MSINPAMNKTSLHEQAWAYVQDQDEFRHEDLIRAIGVVRSTAQKWIYQWERAGHIRVVRSERKKRFYRVAENQAPTPPKYRTDMSAISGQTIHGNIWRSMRMMRQFSPTDLAIHSSTDVVDVSDQAAKEYCRMLTRAGYLRVIDKALPGRREARYRLVKNTGPRPPRERRVRAVFDDNLDEFTHVAGSLQ